MVQTVFRVTDRTIRSFSTAACAVFCAAAVPGCARDPGACYGVHPGDQIAITVVDSYDGNSNYVQVGPVYDHCDFGFDLVQGQVLHASVIESAAGDDNCTVGIISVAPFGAWTWADTYAAPGVWPDILEGEFHASNGACQGAVQVILVVERDKQPFAPSVQGQVPNVVMTRNFAGQAGPNCPSSCIGSFVVNLQKM